MKCQSLLFWGKKMKFKISSVKILLSMQSIKDYSTPNPVTEVGKPLHITQGNYIPKI